MTETRKSTDPCRSCWHCLNYIRRIPNMLLDGPVTGNSTVDWHTDQYRQPDQWHRGDKEVDADDVWDRFEIDAPPKTTDT